MQTAQVQLSKQKWLRRGRVLLLGIALALVPPSFLYLPLIFAYSAAQPTQPLPLGWRIIALSIAALSLLLYLLIPAVEGYLTGRQNAEGCAGVDRGCLVGAASILAFLLATALFLGLVASRLITTCPPTCGEFNGNGFLVGVPLALLAAHVLGCIIGGILGGWLGGLLARRKAHL